MNDLHDLVPAFPSLRFPPRKPLGHDALERRDESKEPDLERRAEHGITNHVGQYLPGWGGVWGVGCVVKGRGT